MLTRTRAAVLVVAALALGACSVHPGDAAVVDGQSISMKKLDDTAKAYCALTLNAAQQQGVKAVSNTDIRRQAVTGLVSLIVARKLAKQEDVTVKPSAYELTDAQRDQIAKAFPKDDADELATAIENSQEVTALGTALAARASATLPNSANQAQLAEQGQALIAKAFAKNDVSFSPRFGLAKTGKAKAATGTLAVTPTDFEAAPPEELPDTQRCS